MMLTLQLLLLAGGVSIELPMEAEATGTTITLGEIAIISSDDPEALAAINDVDLGYMPAPMPTIRQVHVDAYRALVALGVKYECRGPRGLHGQWSDIGVRVLAVHVPVVVQALLKPHMPGAQGAPECVRHVGACGLVRP